MSTIFVNTLTGTSTAGSIAVTGEGNSTTTNLQQGLCKSWWHIVGDGTPAISNSGSFNVSSITDIAVANVASVFTNNMADDDFSAIGMAREQDYIAHCQELHSSILRSTSRIVTVTHNHSDAQADSDGRNHLVHGDLA